MQTVRLAAFVSGADLQLLLPSRALFLGGPALHRRGCISATALARRHREQPMVGTFTSIYLCDGSLHIPGIRAAYRARSARACRGKSNRSVTRPADSFLGGATPIGTRPGNHRAVRCYTQACWPSHFRFTLGKKVVCRLTSALFFYFIYVWGVNDSKAAIFLNSHCLPPETSITELSKHYYDRIHFELYDIEALTYHHLGQDDLGCNGHKFSSLLGDRLYSPLNRVRKQPRCFGNTMQEKPFGFYQEHRNRPFC